MIPYRQDVLFFSLSFSPSLHCHRSYLYSLTSVFSAKSLKQILLSYRENVQRCHFCFVLFCFFEQGEAGLLAFITCLFVIRRHSKNTCLLPSLTISVAVCLFLKKAFSITLQDFDLTGFSDNGVDLRAYRLSICLHCLFCSSG